jgi:hypothetical protein
LYLLLCKKVAYGIVDVAIEWKELFEKHTLLFEREVKGVVSSFGLVAQRIQSHRMDLLLKDVSSYSRNENVQEGTNERNEGIFDSPSHDPPARGGPAISIDPTSHQPVHLHGLVCLISISHELLGRFFL